MKNHLIFCCDTHCRDNEVNELMRTWGENAIMRQRDNITVGDDRYRFFININKSPERIRGLIIDDYRMCEHYCISKEVRDYLSIHIGR